jgi:non-ribosomal peptide synthetase component F
MNEHGSFSSGIASHGKALRLGPHSRALQFSSYAFDAHLTEVMTVLYHGGCVCVPDEETRLNSLVEYMNQAQVTWATFTPSFLKAMNPEDSPSLQTIITAGEAITVDVIDRWASKV